MTDGMSCSGCSEYVTAELLNMSPETWDETHPLTTLSNNLGVSVEQIRNQVHELLDQHQEPS